MDLCTVKSWRNPTLSRPGSKAMKNEEDAGRAQNKAKPRCLQLYPKLDLRLQSPRSSSSFTKVLINWLNIKTTVCLLPFSQNGFKTQKSSLSVKLNHRWVSAVRPPTDREAEIKWGWIFLFLFLSVIIQHFLVQMPADNRSEDQSSGGRMLD